MCVCVSVCVHEHSSVQFSCSIMSDSYNPQSSTVLMPAPYQMVSVAQSCPNVCDPMDCSPPGSSVHRILKARILEWVAMPSSRRKPIFPPRLQLLSVARDWDQVAFFPGGGVWCSVVSGCDPMDYSPWDSPGKNTGVGSHFLLQGIFPIQELNPGLLHCWHILYHLSH